MRQARGRRGLTYNTRSHDWARRVKRAAHRGGLDGRLGVLVRLWFVVVEGGIGYRTTILGGLVGVVARLRPGETGYLQFCRCREVVNVYVYICNDPMNVSWDLGIWKWRGVVYIVFDTGETRSNVLPSPVCADVGPEWLDWVQWMVGGCDVGERHEGYRDVGAR